MISWPQRRGSRIFPCACSFYFPINNFQLYNMSIWVIKFAWLLCFILVRGEGEVRGLLATEWVIKLQLYLLSSFRNAFPPNAPCCNLGSLLILLPPFYPPLLFSSLQHFLFVIFMFLSSISLHLTLILHVLYLSFCRLVPFFPYLTMRKTRPTVSLCNFYIYFEFTVS